MDLEVPRADRRLDAVPVPACLREGLGDGGLARAEEAEHPPPRGTVEARTACIGALATAAGHRRRSSPGGPGQNDEHAAVRGDDQPRRRSRDADHVGAVWDRRLLRHPRGEVGVRPTEPLRDRRDTSRFASRARDRPERRAGDARDELDGPVVVRRPEPARDEADVRFAPGLERRLEIHGSSPTITIRSGVQPERERLTRVERPVAVVSLPAHELAARDDDRRARSRHPARANLQRPFRGMTIRWPFTLTATFRGARPRGTALSS